MRTIVFLPLFLLLYAFGEWLFTHYAIWIIDLNWYNWVKIFLLSPAHILVFVATVWLPVLIAASVSKGPYLAIMIIRTAIIIILLWRLFSISSQYVPVFELIYTFGALIATRKKYLDSLMYDKRKVKEEAEKRERSKLDVIDN